MPHIVRSSAEWVRLFDTVDPASGMILLLAGLVYMLMGIRVFRGLVVLNCAAIGGGVGFLLGSLVAEDAIILQIGLGLVGAVALGAMAVPMVKLGVAVCAGILGGFLGATIAGAFTASPDARMVVGLVGLLVTISLVFVIFDRLIIAVTSFQGALMTTAGALIISGHQSGFLRHFRNMALDSGMVIPFCVLAGTVIGVSIQMAGQHKGAGSDR